MISPLELAERIDESLRNLDELVVEARNAARDAAAHDAKFKAEFAKERLKARAEAVAAGAKLTTDHAEDLATVATEVLRAKALYATHNLTVVREALRAEEARLDGLRTISASVRLAGG